MSTRSLPAERLSALRAQFAGRDGEVVASAELADLYGVSVQTIRRDLAALEEQGLLTVTFGGAVIGSNSHQHYEPLIAVRRRAELQLKQAIGRGAASLLGAGESVYFDASTTVLELITALPHSWDGNATTSSVPAIAALAHKTNGALTLLGGDYRRGSECVGGNAAIEQVAHLRFSIAFLSARALSASLALTEANPSEADLKRVVIRNAERVCVLVDSSKYDRVAPYHFMQATDADELIADEGLPPQVVADLRAAGVNVTLCDK